MIYRIPKPEGFVDVGVTGLEPATPCTPCKYATGLRYTPNTPYLNAPESFSIWLTQIKEFLFRFQKKFFQKSIAKKAETSPPSTYQRKWPSQPSKPYHPRLAQSIGLEGFLQDVQYS